MIVTFDCQRGPGERLRRDLPYVIAPRRAGDIAQCWADPAKARQELGWQASRTLDDMTADTWRWQSQNPNGYPDA